MRHKECMIFAGTMLLRFLILLLLPAALFAQASGDSTLREVPLQALSDRNFTSLGQAALSIRSGEWKHAETANFIYHYFHSFIAAPVAVEAEFYYRVIAKDLEKDTTQWERKSHIFIFELDEDWAAFQQKGALDPWTGGIHSAGSLFLQRNPEMKFKGSTLGHEVTHLVVDRFFGVGVPLWLNEGYAEYASAICYAAFNRARGYAARPTSRGVPAGLYLPLAQLTAMVGYPTDPVQVPVFYHESERLVRFLCRTDKKAFFSFFEAMAKGNRLETALNKGFAARFINLEALDREFKSYATQNNGLATPD
jgi:hypothetical protein